MIIDRTQEAYELRSPDSDKTKEHAILTEVKKQEKLECCAQLIAAYAALKEAWEEVKEDENALALWQRWMAYAKAQKANWIESFPYVKPVVEKTMKEKMDELMQEVGTGKWESAEDAKKFTSDGGSLQTSYYEQAMKAKWDEDYVAIAAEPQGDLAMKGKKRLAELDM